MNTMARLVAERKCRGLTPHDMAARLHVSQACICKWENGQRQITLRDAEAYAAVLGLSLAVLDRTRVTS